MFYYISVARGRSLRRAAAKLIRWGRRRALAGYVADQAVQFVGDFFEIGSDVFEVHLRTAAVLGGFGFDDNQTLAVKFEQFGLAVLDFGDDDQVVLEIFDGSFYGCL